MFYWQRGRARRWAASTVIVCGLSILGCAPNEAAPPANSVVHPELWLKAAPSRMHNIPLERRLDALLNALTLEEKIGQLIQADIGDVTPADVRKHHLGSVLSGGDSGPGGDDLAPPSAWLAAADEFYLASVEATAGRRALPILWGVDAVHGHNNVVGATLFPQNIALGATRNPVLIRRIGEITAIELRVTGQDWTFAPTLAVVQDIRWGRTYESYSEDPALVSTCATALIEGLQGSAHDLGFLRGDHVIATAKHFIADGGTFAGRDQGDSYASELTLRELHGAPYAAAIAASVQAVMASLSSWQGKKIHGHKGLLTDVLKERMGFEGFIVGDWNGHGQVQGCTNLGCAAAVNAGLDMFMSAGGWRSLYENTLAQVRTGEIPMKRLDDAVRRILQVKLRAGLFDTGKPSTRRHAGRFDLLGSAQHRATARQAVRESLVLLKNADHLLPLRPSMNVLVAGDGADNIAKQNGGWTLGWQGAARGNAHFTNAESIYGGIRSAVTAAGGLAMLSVAGEFSAKPDVAIVVFGEEPYAESRGDLDTIEYKPADKSDLALLRRLKAAGIPVVAVLLSGRPLWVNPELNAANAFVAAWLPGSEGGGVADVLFTNADGAVNYDFGGKLPISWPRHITRSPGATSPPPLFAFGFGLTYSDDGALPLLPEDDASEGASAHVDLGKVP